MNNVLCQTKGCDKLSGKKCIVTGGDSRTGRSIAVTFAREGADVAIIYLPEEDYDALETAHIIEQEYKRKCVLVPADLSKEQTCSEAIKKISGIFEHIDILVNNAVVHNSSEEASETSSKELVDSFTLNIFAMFWITKYVIPYMKKGSSIINTPATECNENTVLIDYIVALTRNLSVSLAEDGIRVNGIAPGPATTPLISSVFVKEEVTAAGTDSPLSPPFDIASAYLFLASNDASNITGQFIYVNGDEIINGDVS
jgi:NAD(P)-dependent dehydrogenase (short-subunit alcohol dehydrogenase family)